MKKITGAPAHPCGFKVAAMGKDGPKRPLGLLISEKSFTNRAMHLPPSDGIVLVVYTVGKVLYTSSATMTMCEIHRHIFFFLLLLSFQSSTSPCPPVVPATRLCSGLSHAAQGRAGMSQDFFSICSQAKRDDICGATGKQEKGDASKMRKRKHKGAQFGLHCRWYFVRGVIILLRRAASYSSSKPPGLPACRCSDWFHGGTSLAP